MKLAYFAEEAWERDYIAERLPGIEVNFVLGPLNANSDSADIDTEALSVFVNSTAGSAELDRFPQLKFIATRSTGFDHIDLNETKKRSIVVSSVPSYGINTVAEFAFALLLALARHVREGNARVLAGSSMQEGLTGIDLNGKTIGIVGCGKIGAYTAQIAKGFGMGVIACDMYENSALAKEIGFSYVPFSELLSRSDVISLHAPYTKETHHLINSKNISQIKKGAYLINTARGTLVETKAILDALNNGTLAGAGLDVLEHEDDLTNPEVAALIAHPKALVTPHIGFDTIEGVKRILDTTVANIRAFEAGAPINVVAG